MRRCPQCGAEYGDSASFCERDGALLVDGADAPSPKRARDPQSARLAAFAVAAILLAVALGTALAPTYHHQSDEFDLEFEWEYGDIEFSCSMSVPRADYQAAADSPIDRGGTTSSGHYTYNDGKDEVFAVKEYVVVDEHIRELYSALKSEYEREYGDGSIDEKVAFAGYLLTFVQCCFDYEEDDGEYWKYPLQTLCDGKGDCEDTSILAAALFSAASYSSGLFLLPGHAMLAVSEKSVGEAPAKSPVVRSGYYACETTADSEFDKYPVGRVETEYKQCYFHLYTGYVTKYVEQKEAAMFPHLPR